MTISASTVTLLGSITAVASLATAVYANAMNNSSENYASEESLHLSPDDSGIFNYLSRCILGIVACYG